MTNVKDLVQELVDKDKLTKMGTPSPGCPDCIARTRHLNLSQNHPFAGHGRYGAAGCNCKDPGCPFTRAA